MQSAKDMAASAKSGMEKTNATIQEKAETLTTTDPIQKELATEKKDERIHEAEREKEETRHHNEVGGDPTPRSYGADSRPDYPQGIEGAQDLATMTTDKSWVVPPQDPNVAGGYKYGYGSGNTI